MIPKIIHYCWFGGSELTPEKAKYLQNWRVMNPQYELKMWNENNFDVSKSEFCKAAADAKMFAFVSDYVRLWAVERFGGFYLDIDVEALQSFDDLRGNDCFFGQDEEENIASGLIFGAIPHEAHIRELLDIYDSLGTNTVDGLFKQTTCVKITTYYFKRMGYKKIRDMQVIDGVRIYPAKYFCPLGRGDKKARVFSVTHTIHHYDASWAVTGNKERLIMMRNAKIGRILARIFGDNFVSFIRKVKRRV